MSLDITPNLVPALLFWASLAALIALKLRGNNGWLLKAFVVLVVVFLLYSTVAQLGLSDAGVSFLLVATAFAAYMFFKMPVNGSP